MVPFQQRTGFTMDTTSRILVLLVLVVSTNLDYVQGIVGGKAAPPPPVDDPVVYSRKFDRDSRVFGTRDPQSGYYLFRGIRYAEPPVGNRRFQRPVPVFLEGDINATRWAAPCLQPTENGQIIGSEDCLFLNVFTPNLPDSSEGYPVIIWIHGGGFRRGAATQYEMRSLIQQRTIVVSIQYRLGSLGFLSSGDDDLSGNNGLFDMALATDWVRQYIEFFGGNPNRITAMGQGSGASSAFLLGLSRYGQSYFSGIIAMSGSLLSRFAVEREPRKTTEMIASGNNCPINQTVEMVRCLRELPAARIIEQDTAHESTSTQARNFISDLSTLMGTGPVVEGKDDKRALPKFVQDEPEDSLNSDELPAIPLLTGVVKDETGGAVYGPFKDVISQSLKTIPDFLTKVLVPNLQQIVPTIGNIQKQFVPEAFTKYLDPFGVTGNKGVKNADTIAKVGEALNDAIFNAPAFLTVKNWAKKSKAYLYSFDHDSKHGFGKDFLSGLPIVGKSAENGKTSHGDELGYLFEPNSIHGEALPSRANFNEEDQQVKDAFTNMVAEFARSGNVSSRAKSNDGNFLPFSVPSFSGDDDDGFLSITSKPTVNKQFRFCEMGLWTGMEERFKSAACSFFHVDLKQPLKTFQKTIKSVSNLPKLAKVGSVSDFLNTSSANIPFLPPGLNGISLPKSPISVPILEPGNISIVNTDYLPVGSKPDIKIPNVGSIPGLSNLKPKQNEQQGKPTIPSFTQPKIKFPGFG